MRKKRSSTLFDDLEHGVINLTPLIDVVFVVLIMFILIAPMLELDRVQLAGAPARDDKDRLAVKENSNIAIHVREDNTILINKKPISSEKLREALLSLHAAHPKYIPQLYQDKRAQFGTYQTVKNAVEGAGFEELDVILQP